MFTGFDSDRFSRSVFARDHNFRILSGLLPFSAVEVDYIDSFPISPIWYLLQAYLDFVIKSLYVLIVWLYW